MTHSKTYKRGDFVITEDGYVGEVERIEADDMVVVSVRRWFKIENLTPIGDVVETPEEKT